MKIDRLILGEFETNCYILRDSEPAKHCLIIDPGLQTHNLVDFLRDHKLNPVAVVLTHGHIDHVAGLPLLRENFPNIKVYVHELDASMLTGAPSNLSALTGQPFCTEPADFTVQEATAITEANITLTVFHTPGHTPGGISLYAKDAGIVFVGDTLFASSVGRTDFPGGDITHLVRAIKQKLFTLPDETVVYPGHGPATTVAQEKSHNPFLQ